MPVFQWKARTRDGHQIEGKLNARSKEDVMSRLRAQGLTVTSVEGHESGEPEDPDQVAPHFEPPPPNESLFDRMQRERRTKKPRRFLALLTILGLVAAAVAVGAMAPIVMVRCDRASGGVRCSIDDRILAVIPMKQQTLAGVVSVDHEMITWRERDVSHAKVSIVLHDRLGNTIRPFGWDQGGTLGATTFSMEQDIDRFLGDPRQTSYRRWQGQWVPLLMPVILLLMAVIMVILMFVSFSEGGTNKIYDWVGGLAKAADERRRLHKR